MVDINVVNRHIDTLGETVTVTMASSSTYSDWGDETNTTSSTSAVAVYNVYGKNSVYETDGEFTDGDISFFFKSGLTGMDGNTEIIRSNGDKYKVKDVRDHGIQGNVYVFEVNVDKI